MKIHPFYLIAALVISAAVVSAAIQYDLTKRTPASESGSGIVGNWADDRVLVGNSHYVFVAKVIRQIGTEVPSWASSSIVRQFEIAVVYNVKGDLHGTHVISQFTVTESSVIQPGSTYVFATRYYPARDWYLVAPSESYALITDNNSLDAGQLETLARANDRVLALQTAYPNEILSSADVRENKAYNSYESLKSGSLFTPTPEISPTALPISTNSTAPPTVSEVRSWLDAERLIDECKVTEIDDYHSGVSIVADSGRININDHPSTSEMMTATKAATEKCGFRVNYWME